MGGAFLQNSPSEKFGENRISLIPGNLELAASLSYFCKASPREWGKAPSGPARWCMPVILTLTGQIASRFEATLGYNVRPCFKGREKEITALLAMASANATTPFLSSLLTPQPTT